MLLSQILAWITAILCLMEVLRFAARLSKVKALNRFFHKIHIPFGVLAILAGGVHGVLAGNLPDAAPADLEWAPLLFTLNWGTAVYLCILLLGLTYLLRRLLKKKWMLLHRLLTALLIALLTLHLLDVGIALPGQLFPAEPEKGTISAVVPTQSPVSRPTAEPAAQPMKAPTAGAASEDAPASSAAESSESEPEPEPSQEPVSQEEPIFFSGAVLADGVYEGSAGGRNGPITVSVTVEEGAVTEFYVTDHRETPKYFSRAENVIYSILSEQSLETDAVTGATLTSDGIKNAAYNALLPAVLSGELQVS